MFTDWYGQQSCTAGRAAFITGQSPIRTGLTKVGLPGSKLGLQPEDPTIAELLKPHGYACGQFGKNHLGDRDEFLPTVHGFDEFFGNLYHLNAEEEPENPDYPIPKNTRTSARSSARAASCIAGRTRDGTQRIEDTGPLDQEAHGDHGRGDHRRRRWTSSSARPRPSKPFFCWWNSTRMHVWTHLKAESIGKTGLGVYADGMVEHDGHVGQLLAKLDELGIADNTIVMYSTDNGAEELSWPDGGTTPFRGEKDTNYEGGWRVPTFIRWPGVIKPGTVSNEIFSHQDMLPTLVAAAGEPDIVEKCRKGYTAGSKTFKVYLDGFNMLPYLKGEVKKNPRPGFLYWSDEGDLMAIRYGDWKVHFTVQRAEGMMAWQEPFTSLRFPILVNLRSDPFENAEVAADLFYNKWRADRVFILVPAGALVAQYMQTMMEFPPRQSPESWSPTAMLEKLKEKAATLNTAAHRG